MGKGGGRGLVMDPKMSSLLRTWRQLGWGCVTMYKEPLFQVTGLPCIKHYEKPMQHLWMCFCPDSKI
jgi:hypothetical protein